MTVALAIKVNDGVVLAADSAATFPDANGNAVFVYNHANKIFNLCKGFPLGLVSWGAGSIGGAAMETLLKDLRVRFTGNSAEDSAWQLKRENCSVLDVAKRVGEFVHEQHVAARKNPDDVLNWGCLIAGYSCGEAFPEVYSLVGAGNADPPVPQQFTGPWVVGGQGEAISRLLNGYDPGVEAVLRTIDAVPDDKVTEVLQHIADAFGQQVVVPGMPIRDAIDVARFLVEVTIGYSRITPYAATVGGPIEVAAITKHEGFKWVQRKYYYPRDLNPKEDDGGTASSR